MTINGQSEFFNIKKHDKVYPIKLKRILKKMFIKLSGKKNYLKIGIKCNANWYGNQYGGFFANPDYLNKNSIVYSFGIGEDISFDREIISCHGSKVFGFDPTPKSINWIKNQILPKEFCFYNYGIGTKNEVIDFFLPLNEDHVSGSIIKRGELLQNSVKVNVKKLTTICKELGHNKVNLLKMDIEGFEYEILKTLFDNNLNIDQILIEFHDRFFINGKEKSENAISFLKSRGYEIFAISDTFEEVSFINKELC